MSEPAAGMKYRATLVDNDKTRERPLTIYGNSIEEIRAWAKSVLPKAMDGAVILVFQTMEQQVETIRKEPKP
jgi:hypothetical protein